MKNVKMNAYHFNEATEFDGLMPKTMELLGEEYCIGGNDIVVSSIDQSLASNSLSQSADALEVVSPDNIMSEN